VGSSTFGILWKRTYDLNELFFAKPLTYTPTGKSQLVFLASMKNIIRTVDALNGTLLKQRQVQPPFSVAGIACTDIPNFIGILGTPIIDPNTDTVYFFSKGYQGQASSGGLDLVRYSFYAVDINTLEDKPGFPVLIDGHHADNDVTKFFVGGNVLQRPSLTMLNGVVIGGFGGFCDLFNYTGMLVAVSTQPGVGITSIYATEGGPGSAPETNDLSNKAGGEAGIWQAGFGLSTDNSRIFLATGNGEGHVNINKPASGHAPLSTLDEVVADFNVSAAGILSLTDYFEPSDYLNLDYWDNDLGAGGVSLLDSNAFHSAGVNRIAVCVGKTGTAYILNADNLGGFKQGPGGTDNILQTIVGSGRVFGGSGSYPLEGGYIYFTPLGSPTVCYKFGFNSSGSPNFTFVGQTKTVGTLQVGIGPPTITTYKGQAGTGILWVTDPQNGLQAFNAVPDNTGTLTPITLPPTGGLNNFQRPAFGDGTVYVSDNNGNVYCLGPRVASGSTATLPVAIVVLSSSTTSGSTTSTTSSSITTTVTSPTTSTTKSNTSKTSTPSATSVSNHTPSTSPTTAFTTATAQSGVPSVLPPTATSSSIGCYTKATTGLVSWLLLAPLGSSLLAFGSW
jgi:iron transport multicopper oxidase